MADLVYIAFTILWTIPTVFARIALTVSAILDALPFGTGVSLRTNSTVDGSATLIVPVCTALLTDIGAELWCAASILITDLS